MPPTTPSRTSRRRDEAPDGDHTSRPVTTPKSQASSSSNASSCPTTEEPVANEKKRPRNLANTDNSHTDTNSNNPKKKRPYRRTKRPENYNDKSTWTTISTSTASMPMNAYDAVLEEASDLVLAAREAQLTGRLKMASGYLLLLHARLVGLGKRFDKAGSYGEESNAKQHATIDQAREEQDDHSKNTANPSALQMLNSPDPKAASSAAAAANANSAATPKTRAAQQLAQLLPSNIELDTAMMEHLAKAAVELHASRFQKPSSASSNKLASPDARTFFAGTANSKGIATQAVLHQGGGGLSSLHTALAQGTSNPRELARQTGRTEHQVAALLKTRQEGHKVQAHVLPQQQEKPGLQQQQPRQRKPATTAITTVPHAVCNARTLLSGNMLKKK